MPDEAPSLVKALAEFMDEWDANQRWAGVRGIELGTCDLCGRERYVQYNIILDVTLCSARCQTQHQRLMKAIRGYAVQK